MAGRDYFDKTAHREQHIFKRLIRGRFGKEDDEIDRVALGHRHSDFAVALEPADAGPVARTGVHHDDRWFGDVNTIVPTITVNFSNPEQCIVGRALELPRVQQRFVFEIQQRRHARTFMRDHVVGPFAQRIQKQHRAFPQIATVSDRIGRPNRFGNWLGGTFRVCGNERLNRGYGVHAEALLAKKFHVGTKITATYQP